MQIMKEALRASQQDGQTLELALAAFLLNYSTSPHSTTGVTPCSLFVGREHRTRLDLLAPNMGACVWDKKSSQKDHHDRHSRARGLAVGQSVWAQNFRDGPTWVQGEVIDQVGPLSYLVQLCAGEMWRRHNDHLRAGRAEPPQLDTPEFTEGAEVDPSPLISSGRVSPPREEPVASTSPPKHTPTGDTPSNNSESNVSELNDSVSDTLQSNAQESNASARLHRLNTRHYPSRNRQPPDRYC